MNTEEDGIFPAMNFGKVISRDRFEDILKYLHLSHASDPNEQLLESLYAVNVNLKEAMTPGNTCLDQSMVQSYHRNLKGKMKIKRKPHPVGN